MPDVTTLLSLLNEFAWLGNWLFFTLAFIESAPFVGLFMPGATLVSVGGLLASQGYLKAFDIIIFATMGAIIGDFFSYSLGRWGGDWISKKKIINQKILNHGEKFFNKYGNISIFWGRFFGPVRAIIPFIAGVSKMKPAPFIFWNILSAVGWATLNVFLGYFSGTLVVSIFKKWSSGLTLILIVIISIGVIYWLIKKRGHSITASFHANSSNFIGRLNNYRWFKKIKTNYPIVTEYFKETKHANEKLYGGLIISSFLIFVYLLIIILDVF
jgi:membrane protein DedA with SNARE-associated domain